jgi:hypothetical protein
MPRARSNADIECMVTERAEVRRCGVSRRYRSDPSLALVGPNGGQRRYDIDATAVRNRRPMKELPAA